MMENLVCILSLNVIMHLPYAAEELLIDFRELIGEHSGENMAEAVWATMELYGLVGKVSFWPSGLSLCLPVRLLMVLQIIAIVMDNASNNNTMMVSLERRCQQRAIQFSAQDARMRCMPHTIHLAAIKVLFLPSQLFCIMSNLSLFSFWKESEQCRRLKARRQPRAAATTKITLQRPYRVNMTTMQQLMMRSTRSLQIWMTMQM
jgi:hypothetical protein